MGVRSGLKRELSALWDGGTGTALLAVASVWGVLVGARMILPVLIPSLQETYALSLPVAGLLVSVLWLFAALGQLPGGVLADRYPERTLMAGGALVVAVALALVVTASTPAVLFLATALWGVGHSMYPIARITVLSKLYQDRLGSALGVTMATGDVGQTILPPIATVVAGVVAWQAGLGFVVPLLVVGALAIYLAVPARPTDVDHEPLTLRETLGVFRELRTSEIGTMAVILFLFMFLWQSFTAFYPTYLESIKGLSPAVASLLFGFFFAVGVVVKPLAGAAYDRFGMRRSLVAVLSPPTVGLLALPFVSELWALVAVTALVATMLGSGAITQSFLADSFTDERQGAGLGVVRTATATLGAAGPVVFGVIGEYGFFDQGYLALAVIMVVVIGLTLRMPRA
ncbi:MFS transporter [Halovivax gelatinilyticus]|uniref:MFS transporter n=1 Tax=Halovivax gelatinilyticus TaxID=2961597 RepID=UPI0020CA7034|nr:MFS transporter [Halovivax gelatinilyticus]